MTLRAPLIALAVCLTVVCGALLLGRAIDQQLRASCQGVITLESKCPYLNGENR